MRKFSYDEKKKIIEEYEQGCGGTGYLAKVHGIGRSYLSRLIKAYEKFGDVALQPTEKPKEYSLDFKLQAVEWYISGNISYDDLAMKLGIMNPTIIGHWVRKYRTQVNRMLEEQQQRSKTTMAEEAIKKKRGRKRKDFVPEDEQGRRMKELEDENLKLRIENAYLKALRRLQMEEEAAAKNLRGSSAVSGKNSN